MIARRFIAIAALFALNMVSRGLIRSSAINLAASKRLLAIGRHVSKWGKQ